MNSVSYWPLHFSASMLEGEAINLGVVVAAGSGNALRWKIQPDARKRIDRAFRGQKLGPVAALQLAYVEAELCRLAEQWSSDSEELVARVDAWAARLANQTRLGARAEMRVVEGIDPIEHLFGLLVHDAPAATERPVRTDRLLWQRFRSERLDKYVFRPDRMEVPVGAQAFSHKFTAAYQNGRMNYVQAERLPERGDKELGPRVAWLRELAKGLQTEPPHGNPSALVVVATAKDVASLHALRECMVDCDAQVHDLDDLEALLEDVRRAKDLHSLT